jgi:hypothetical protein
MLLPQVLTQGCKLLQKKFYETDTRRIFEQEVSKADGVAWKNREWSKVTEQVEIESNHS